MSVFDDFFARRLAEQPAHVTDVALAMCEEIRVTAEAYLSMVELEVPDSVATTERERDAFRAGVEAGLLATLSTLRRRQMLRGDTGEVQP